MAVKMTVEQADAVLDILHQYAGAPGSPDSWMREDFRYHQTAGSTDEYRFQGSLGYGGKFWNCNDKWYVSAYREDLTPERQAAIDATNAALAALKETS